MLVHTLNQILACVGVSQIWLVLPGDWIDYWKTEVYNKQTNWRLPVNVVVGGKTRTESVWAALQEITNNNPQPEFIAVHDACRPLITRELIQETLKLAQKSGNAVPVVPLKSSVRKITANGGSEACNRDDFREVQTPQVFSRKQIMSSYQKLHNYVFSDDASLVEAAGFPISLTTGKTENIKVTTEEDLFFVERFLNKLKTQENS